MTRTRLLLAAACAASLGAVSTPGAAADDLTPGLQDHHQAGGFDRDELLLDREDAHR